LAARQQREHQRLLRQYFPRGTDLSRFSQAYLNRIARRLNQRPRKTLGFETLPIDYEQCCSDQLNPQPILLQKSAMTGRGGQARTS
jgi:hypothetical protein